MRKIFTFIGIFILLVPSLLWGEKAEPVLTIYYSSSLNGNLDGCKCKSNPRAGLVKRAFYLNQIEHHEKTILLDAGDILDVMPDNLLADHIFSVYDELGYNAISLGDQEFLNGIDKLLEYRTHFPLLAHNLYICPETKDSCILFSIKPEIIKKNDMLIGIFSIFDPALVQFLKQKTQSKIKVKNPVDTARIMVTLMEEYEVDINILLFHGYYQSAKNVIQKVKGIDVVVLGHEQLLIDMTKVENTIFVSPGKEGNRLGKLTVFPEGKNGFSFSNSFIHFNYYTDPDDTSVRRRINSYYDKMMIE